MADSRYLTYFFMIVVSTTIFSNFFVTIEGLEFQEDNEFTSSQLSIGINRGCVVGCHHPSVPDFAKCNGRLEMYTDNPNPRRRIINLAQRQGKRSPFKVRKMRPLHDFSNSRLFVKVNGNCCWKLFQRNFFRGTSDVLLRGDEREFSFYPKSLRLVECPSRA